MIKPSQHKKGAQKKYRDPTVNVEKLYEFRCLVCNQPIYRSEKSLKEIDRTHQGNSKTRGFWLCGSRILVKIWKNPEEVFNVRRYQDDKTQPAEVSDSR